MATLLMATLVLAIPQAARPQVPTPTPEQFEMLKTLPGDQRDALVKGVLGGQNSGVDQNDPKLQVPRNKLQWQKEENERKFDRLTGEPQLRSWDTLILRLEIRRFAGPDEPGVAERTQEGRILQYSQQRAQLGQVVPQYTPPQQTREQSSNVPAVSGERKPIERLEDELKKLEELRDRILRRNPYQLDSQGALLIPEVGSVALAGLTVDEARQRLAVEVQFKDFIVGLTLLPLEAVGEQGLKPFGYELFSEVPSTFAPVTDMPVPADYIVGAGDQIEVQLFGNTNKKYRLTVGRDGQINFPELGPITVGGKRFVDVRSSLEQRIADQMIGVRASIDMGDTRSIRVFVLGEAQNAGSYTVSGLSTMTNALFASGGVKKIGSLRNIQLKRNGQLVTSLDLYDLLLKGDTSGDRRLLPGDVIFIPPVGATVAVTGEVRRPAIYELKTETSPTELLQLAGGLTPEADPSLAKLEHVNEQHQRVVLNVDLTGQSSGMVLRAGDLLRIPSIRKVVENSVLVQGHVHRESGYEYQPGLRLSDVLSSFDELKPQADTHYVLIRRELPPDRIVTVISADLAKALAGKGSDADVPLMPRDRITVFDLGSGRDRIVTPLIDELKLQSKFDRPTRIVEIGGRVKVPGRYPLEREMRVSDLIRAGGSLDDAAYGGYAELTRYKVVDGEQRRTDLIEIDLAAALKGDSTANVVLEPYDFLNVKELPQWRDQEEIEVLGEVRFPGKYPIQRGETLRSLLARTGGLTDLAFPEGSVFIREDLKRREQQQIESLAKRMQTDITVLALQATQANAQSAQALTVGQSLLDELRNSKAVGRLVVNLDKIMTSPPKSELDIALRGGDKLMIPKKAQEVTVLGEVQSTISHLYQSGLTRDDYISLSGGATQKADKKRIYVVRADGSVIAGRGRWFQQSNDEIRPGDSIVVPLDAERMRPLPLWTAVTQIVYNLAIAAAAVNSF